MKKYKTLADKVMAGSEFTISHDGQGFGIWDRKAKSFVSKERWPKEKDAKDFGKKVEKAIKNLKDREKYIITERYMMGMTQIEIAQELGISQAQISRIEKSGLENIKRNMSSK